MQKNTPKDVVTNFQRSSIKLIKFDKENGRSIAQSQAGTESESSKDYVGRVVYEFFQNAVDRADKNIWMELTKDKFIISNDGQAFSIYEGENDTKRSDFHSLNSIHDGEKVAGESIGNKGVGFKSCWNVSQHVIVESIKDDEAWGFELFTPVKINNFDNEEIKQAIKTAEEKVPSFYFPKFFQSKIENFNNTAVTIITINLKDKDAYAAIKKQIEEFIKTKFLFLNLLKGKENKEYQIHLSIDNKEETLNSKNENWHRVDLKSSSMFANELEELINIRRANTYENIPKKPNIAIVFPPDNVESLDANFYTYLPTEKKCGFNVLIHADFALDNARTHIPDNLYNNTLLKIAAKLFVNELLTNDDLHIYENFAKFLMPQNKIDKFAKLVYKEFIKNDKLTKILQNVYSQDRKFPKESYEKVFDVITIWKRTRNNGEWKDNYYNEIYNEIIKYFCDINIFIVWISENEKTFLAPKKEEKNYEYHLFIKDEDNKKSILDYSLLSNIENIKVTDFDILRDKTEFFKNKIIRKFSTLEILRVLKKYQNKNIILFVKQLLENTKEELSFDIKRELLEIEIPVDEIFVKVKQAYINIDDEIKQLFKDDFIEVDVSKIKGVDNVYLTKIGVANNRLPFYKDKDSKEVILAFKDGVSYPLSNRMKDLVKNSIAYIDDETIKELSELEWFYDEGKNRLYKPNEVFLFKEHDNRKIESIAQEKKDKQYQELYNIFNIDEIDETTNSNKLIQQLIMMGSQTSSQFVDNSYHQNIYKNLTFTLSKIDDIDTFEIPLLVTQIDATSKIKYISKDEKNRVVFLETKYKKYKEQIKENYSYLAHFDNSISDRFLEKIGVQKFNPDYIIEYKNENNKDTVPQEDKEVKEFLQGEFLAPFFALASEVIGSKFEKEETLKRWENLLIKKAYNVLLTINDKNKSITVSSTKIRNIDVLYIPIKDKYNKPTQIGEVAHDLDEPKQNSNLRKFSQVFAEGIFRNMKLKSDFELYITAYLTKDENLQEEILTNKGIEESYIDEMKNFIKINLLTKDEKDVLIKMLNDLGINIEQYQDIFNYTKFENLDISFSDFINKFSDKYTFIAQNIVGGYKQYYYRKIENLISKNTKELEILCFMNNKEREEFRNKLKDVKNIEIAMFKEEFDIFKLFEVKQVNKKSDEYIEAMLDFENFTDEIKNQKINFKTKSTTLQAKSNPYTCDAKESKKSNKEQEKKLEKRGLGQELKIAYKYAKEIKNKTDFIDTIKEQIFVDDDGLKENNNIKKYRDKLDDYKEADNLTFAKNVIQIASHSLDGLGYDLIIPSKKGGILKVELKSTTSSGDIEIHFSKNELERIMHYMEVKNYEIWLNCEDNPITKEVKNAVKELENLNLPFYSQDYILKLGVVK